MHRKTHTHSYRNIDQYNGMWYSHRKQGGSIESSQGQKGGLTTITLSQSVGNFSSCFDLSRDLTFSTMSMYCPMHMGKLEMF